MYCLECSLVFVWIYHFKCLWVLLFYCFCTCECTFDCIYMYCLLIYAYAFDCIGTCMSMNIIFWVLYLYTLFVCCFHCLWIYQYALDCICVWIYEYAFIVYICIVFVNICICFNCIYRYSVYEYMNMFFIVFVLVCLWNVLFVSFLLFMKI